MIDITPATERLGRLLGSISETDLERATPCPENSVGDLADHISMFAKGFAMAARKTSTPRSGPPPKPDADNLEPEWRDRLAAELAALAAAWQDPAAWDGMTAVGGLELPGGIAGLVALDELLVHGWDLAVATGQPFDPPVTEIEAAAGFVEGFDAPRDGRLFGPVVAVPDDAPPLDRLLGLTGRDPAWSPPMG
jgi:uncharacterized protein (TIGR03086 family)